jgi:hypothetical protein
LALAQLGSSLQGSRIWLEEVVVEIQSFFKMFLALFSAVFFLLIINKNIYYYYKKNIDITISYITYNHSCIFHFGGRFGLDIGMVYFGTGQYRRFVSGLPLYIYIFTYLYVYSSKCIIC